MEITVKLFATLRDYLPENSDGHTATLNTSDTLKVKDVLEMLKVPLDIPKIVLINGLQKNENEILKDGDTLSVFPPVAGG